MEKLLHSIFGCVFTWIYRNPANRTCSVCGKNQQSVACWFEHDTNNLIAIIRAKGHWETFYEGSKNGQD